MRIHGVAGDYQREQLHPAEVDQGPPHAAQYLGDAGPYGAASDGGQQPREGAGDAGDAEAAGLFEAAGPGHDRHGGIGDAAGRDARDGKGCVRIGARPHVEQARPLEQAEAHDRDDHEQDDLF